MNQLQKKLLGILSWFHDYCVKENLRYYVVGGTMIGAARHKGFIPWDDDIDVAMPRSDYNRLIALFQKSNNRLDKYILETIDSDAPDFLYTFGKLYDLTTTMTEKLKKECRRGVYLDIFPLDGVGDSLEEAQRYYKKIDRWNMFLMTRVCTVRKGRSIYKNMSIIVSRLLPEFIVNDKEIARKIDNMCKTKDFDKCKYVCNCSSRYRGREIIEKRLLGKPTEYEFEGITVWGAEKCDEYLTHMFGDWKKLPPKEKQVAHHDFIELNLNKSYLEK